MTKILCECGLRINKITVKHLNSKEHIERMKKQDNVKGKTDNELASEFIEQYNSQLTDDKIVMSRNLRPTLRKEPKRFIRIFYSRGSKNSFVIADYTDYETFEFEGRTFTLREVAIEQEGIPVYWIFLDFTFSVGLEFNKENNKLIEKGYYPADVNAYLHSQATDTMYRIKRKYGFSDLLSHFAVALITGLIATIVFLIIGNVNNAGSG